MSCPIVNNSLDKIFLLLDKSEESHCQLTIRKFIHKHLEDMIDDSNHVVDDSNNKLDTVLNKFKQMFLSHEIEEYFVLPTQYKLKDDELTILGINSKTKNMSDREELQPELRNSLAHQQQLEQQMLELQAQLDQLRQPGYVPPLQQEVNDVQANENQEVYAVSYFKLIPFWNAKPQAWFNQVESVMRRRKLTTDMAKYDAVVEALDQSALEEASDILAECPERDRYNYLKERPLKALGGLFQRLLFNTSSYEGSTIIEGIHTSGHLGVPRIDVIGCSTCHLSNGINRL